MDVVEDEDAGIRDLGDEREGLLRILGAHLHRHAIAPKSLGDRPRPHWKAAELRGAPDEGHEAGLVVHRRDDQRVPRGQEQPEVVGAVHGGSSSQVGG